MKVLALDPGYGRLGIAVVEKSGGKEIVLYSDCIETTAATPFPERLRALGSAIESAIAMHAPEACALEHLFFTNNQKTAMHVAEARGMILYIASTHDIPVFEYTPNQVKVAVAGDGRADKGRLMAMVARLVATRADIKHDDEYDAIAVGLTCLAIERFPKIAQQTLSTRKGSGA